MAKGKSSLKIGRKCPFCSHVWMGRPDAKRCAKCDKIIGAATPSEVAAATGVAVKPPVSPSETPEPGATGGDATVEVKQVEKQLSSEALHAVPTDTVVPGLYRQDQAPQIPDVPPEMLSGAWKVLFDMAAAYQKSDAWRLKENEAKNLGELTVPVVRKYAPAVLKEHYELAILGMSLTAIIIGKMQLAAEAEKEKKAHAAGVGGNGGRENAQPGAV